MYALIVGIGFSSSSPFESPFMELASAMQEVAFGLETVGGVGRCVFGDFSLSIVQLGGLLFDTLPLNLCIRITNKALYIKKSLGLKIRIIISIYYF